MTADNKKLIRFGLYLTAVLVFLALQFYRETETEAKLSEYFDDKLFNITGVTTKLVHFKNENDRISIKLDATGLPKDAVSYKPQILSYVCSESFLKDQLKSGKLINFDMSASDRHEGSFVNMRINQKRCVNGS